MRAAVGKRAGLDVGPARCGRAAAAAPPARAVDGHAAKALGVDLGARAAADEHDARGAPAWPRRARRRRPRRPWPGTRRARAPTASRRRRRRRRPPTAAAVWSWATGMMMRSTSASAERGAARPKCEALRTERACWVRIPLRPACGRPCHASSNQASAQAVILAFSALLLVPSNALPARAQGGTKSLAYHSRRRRPCRSRRRASSWWPR